MCETMTTPANCSKQCATCKEHHMERCGQAAAMSAIEQAREALALLIDSLPPGYCLPPAVAAYCANTDLQYRGPIEMHDLVSITERQLLFSKRTFGPGERTRGIVDHISNELLEIMQSKGKDLMEWIDVIILALDGAWREGFKPDEIARALHEKQTVNEGRKWPDWRKCDKSRAIEHIRN